MEATVSAKSPGSPRFMLNTFSISEGQKWSSCEMVLSNARIRVARTLTRAGSTVGSGGQETRASR